MGALRTYIQRLRPALFTTTAFFVIIMAMMGCDAQTDEPVQGWHTPEELYQRALTFEKLGIDPIAHTWYLKAAEAGHPMALVELGFRYKYGDAGFLRNPDEARRWFLQVARERAPITFADFKDRNALTLLASTDDASEAEHWFRRGAAACHDAAQRGDMNAQTLLGGLYGAGAGVARDRAKALALWYNAAQRGYAPAQLTLGRLFWHEGAYEEAHVWLRTAAEHDLAEAEYLLSDLYQFGRGVPSDHDEALRWLRQSADHGYSYAQRQLRGMEVQGLLD